MPAQDPVIRNIKIKTGVVKRLVKEKGMYEKELTEIEGKIEKMKNEGKDEYDIKKQIEVKNESAAMIPDCKQRLKKAHEELTQILENEKNVSDSEEYKDAQTVLKDAGEHMA